MACVSLNQVFDDMKNLFSIFTLLAPGFVFSLVSPASATPILDVDFSMWSGRVGDVDGASDGDRVQDLSGNNYHGFWGGGVGANNTPIIVTPTGTGVDSTSTDGYVILRDGLSITEPWHTGTTPSPYLSLQGGNSYTFEGVLNWQGNNNARDGIMGFTGAVEWWIREDAGNIEYVFDDGPDRVENTATIDVSALINNSNWHHLGIVLDATANEIRTYLDYNLIFTDTDAAIANLDTIGDGLADLRLGGYNTTAANRFNGLQDHFRISDTALIPGQFLSIIPEPSALGLLIFGLVFLVGLRRVR